MVERIGNEEGVEFGANVEAAEPILVAQANTGTAGQPTSATPAAAEARVVVELENGNVLRLPDTASVDQPRTNGADLEFVQADGSVIIVPNGAIQGLTIFIGAAEIPPLTVAALFESNGIETAAGPAGAGASARGSGGNFEVPVGGIGDAFALGDLLDPTELAFGANTLEDLYPDNTKPSFLLGNYSFRISEEGLAPGLADFGPNSGLDTTDDSFYFINLGASDPDGDTLTFTLSAPTTGLTSNGELIVWEGIGTNHLIGKVGDATVIDITVGGKSGLLLVQLLEPIDHPAGNIEDVLDLGFTVTANDGRGGTATATITIGIEDDSPEVGVSQSAGVDEDGLESGVKNSDSRGDNDGNAKTATGALGIKWGADNGDVADALNKDGSFAQDGSGRSVYFSQANIDAFLANYGSLTSGGLPLVFSWSANKITASVVGEGESSQPIFQISLSDDASGSYKFQLFGPLDHEPYGGQPSGEGDGDSDDLPGEGEMQAKVEGDDEGEDEGDSDNYEDDIVLNFEFTAKDADGDTVGGSFTVTVDDDMPVLVTNGEHNNVRIVDEDDIRTEFSHGTSPNDGAGDGSYTGNPATNGAGPAYIYGSLGGVVNFGADGFGGFGINSGAYSTFATYGLTSNGDPLSYFVENGEIWTTFTATAGEDGRTVFEFRLNVTTGAYEFRLYDQLDHDAPPSGADQNFDLQNGEGIEDVFALDFGSIVRAFDGDGDYVDLVEQLLIKVRDDVPELVRGQSEIRTVDEDDIDTSLSTGTSPNDGNADGSYTDSPSNNSPGAATVTGSLAHLVKSGADENLRFDFVSGNTARSQLSALGLKSNGETLSYDLQGNVLYGFVNANGIDQSYDVGDRPVFKLTVNDDGSYKFDLIDQLDHDRGDGQNFDLQDSLSNQDVTAINFGKVIVATDNDGDSVSLNGAFQIKVRDDVPELVKGKSEIRIVDEDDIRTIGDGLPGGSTGTSPNDGNADGSYTGSPNNNGLGAATITGSLAHLVKSGADENLRFDFVSGNTARSQLSALGLKSNGETLSYDLQGNVLYAFVNKGGTIGQTYDESEDRPVFKLTLNPNDGSYKFELIDQLDHDRGDGQNFDLQSRDIGSINFGKLILATDNDGDSVSLDGAFQIKVRDDVPELVKGQSEIRIVDEDDIRTIGDGLPGGSTGTSPNDGNADGSYTGSPNNNGLGAATITGSLAHLVKSGADENLRFDFVSANTARSQLSALGLKSNGETLSYDLQGNVLYAFVNKGGTIGQTYDAGEDRPVFKLTLNPDDGSYKFELIDQLDHDRGDGQNFDLQSRDVGSINFGKLILATDNDGDSVSLDGAFQIKIRDDVPEASLKLKDGAKLILDETRANSPHDTDANADDEDEEGVSNPFHSYGQLIGYAAGGSGTLFTASPSVGADENGSTVYALSISGNNDSGVDDTATGQNILLFKEGNNIVGRVGNSHGAVAFVISADANTGAVKVYQFRAVEHDNDGGTQADHDESGSPEYLAAGKITLTQTVTDEDGDKDTASIDLGKVIGFEDDGPKITRLELNDRVLVSHDETPGVNGDADDVHGSLSVFKDVANKGDDLDVDGSGAIGFAKEDKLISFGTDFGTDGKASSNNTVFSLVLKGGNGQDSGLKTTEGATIKLYLEKGIIVGRVGDANGVAAFAIAVDSDDGDISMVQYLSIQHPTGGNSHDESVGLDLVGTNAIEVQLTIKDGDGDTDSKSVDISDAIGFQDDGPSIAVDRVKNGHDYLELKTALLDETTQGGNPNDNTGNKDWSLTTDPATAVAIGQVTSSASGSGSVAGLFVTDPKGGADGVQSVVKAFTFDLRNDKGNVVADTTTGVETTLRVTQVVGNTTLGGLSNDDRTIWLYRVDDKTIIGKIHGKNGEEYIALKIALTGTAENPQFTVTQYLPVDHPNSGNPDDAVSLKFDDKDASLSIKLTATITDKDGDTATDSESVKIIGDKTSIVTIEDDGPTITGVTFAPLGQELIQNGGFELGHNLTGNNWNLFDAITGWTNGGGAPFEVQTGGAGGVVPTNGAVVELDGDTESNGAGNGTGVATPTGSTNASIQQVVSGTEAGQTYQLTFDYAPRTNGGDNTAGLEVYFGGEKVFPPVGQTYAANQWRTITLTVTAPSNDAVLEFRGTGAPDEYGALIDNVSVKAKTFGLDDESQAGGIPGGPGDDRSGKVLAGKINFDAGTDHLKAIVVDDDIDVKAIWVDATTGIGRSVDVDVEWVQNGQGGRLVGTMSLSNETRPVFELVVNADGTFTLTMQAPLAHPSTDDGNKNNGTETEWEDNISLEFDYKVIDNDGDAASGSIKVSVDDDTPDFVGGIEDQTVQTLGQAVNGDLNIKFGADGQYADKGLVISDYQKLPGVNAVLSDDGRTLTGYAGGTPIYQLKLKSNGTYDFTQFAKVPGVSVPPDEVNLEEGFHPTVSRDYDGFTISAMGHGNQLNSSGQGIGVNNNGINDGEKLRIDFDDAMSSVTLDLDLSGNSWKVIWKAYDENGTLVDQGTTSTFNSDGGRIITPDSPFYRLEIEADKVSGHSNSGFRLEGISGTTAGISLISSLDFTVTAKDGDKDAQSDSFTVTLKNNTPPTVTVNTANANDSVPEAALPAGTHPNTTAATVTGTITVADADGLADIVSVTINGGAGSETQSLANLVNKTIQGAHGTLTITGVTNGVISYSYLLTSATTDIQNALETDVFSVSVSDGEESASASITIEIVDDVPTAVNDAGYGVTEDGASLVSGNVLTNDVSGADTPKSFVSWSATDTAAITALNTYGTLTRDGDGNWSFALDNTRAATQALTAASDLSFTLNYTMKDGDGDQSSATLTITIKGANDSATVKTVQADGADHTVYESGLNPNGSNANADTETVTGSFKVTATDGISSVVIGGTSFTFAELQALNETQTVSTGEGTLTLTSYTGSAAGGTVNYSYTLNAKIDNDTHDGATPTGFDDSITVTVNGIGGTTASDTIIVTIVDDVPTANADSQAQSAENDAVTVNVLANDTKGADGVANAHVALVAGSLSDATGSVVYNNDGTFTYSPSAGKEGTVTFQYTITDGDGDPSTATVTIELKADSVPTLSVSDGTVDEKGLANGSGEMGDNIAGNDNSETTHGTITFGTGGDALSKLEINGQNVTAATTANPITVPGTNGVLTITRDGNGDYKWSYTLTKNLTTHSVQGAGETQPGETFTVKVTDSDNSTATDTLDITVKDDAPVAVNISGGFVTEDGSGATIGGNVTNHAGNRFGADGKADPNGVTFGNATATLDGNAVSLSEYGTFTQNATTGEWKFVLDNGSSKTQALKASDTIKVSFDYTLKDGDADTAPKTVSFTIKGADDSGTVTVTPDADAPSNSGIVHEKGLTSSGDNSEIETGTFNVTATDGVASVTIGGTNHALANWVGKTVDTVEGTLKITAVSTAADGKSSVFTYEYVLKAAQTHTQAGNDSIIDTIGIAVAGIGGSNATGDITIKIIDDVPVVDFTGQTSVAENAAGTISGSYLFRPGADGILTGTITVTVGASVFTVTASELANGETINTAAGQLVLSAPATNGSGTWTFDPSSVSATTTVNIAVSLTDKDGDISTDTHTITVNNVSGPLLTSGAVSGVVEEEHGLPGGVEDQTANPDYDNDITGNPNVTTNTASGSYAPLVTGGIDGTLAYAFKELTGNPAVQTVANGPLTSGGQPVLFAMDATGNLIGFVNSNSNGGYQAGADVKVFTMTLNPSTGAYTFTLNAPVDHPFNNPAREDSIEINLNGYVTATDVGDSSAGNTRVGLNGSITVIDDVPIANNDTATLNIVVDDLSVGSIVAAWTNVQMTSDSVNPFDRDGDGSTDEIRWPNGSGSGYGFVDNPSLANVPVSTNETFSLGTFTHYNFPVSGGTLESTTLSVTFTAVINGEVVQVGPILVNFDHTETDNNGSAEQNRDIISISTTTTTVNIEGQNYTLDVRGFVDTNNNIVSTVRTYENQQSNYQLAVRFVSSDSTSVTKTGDVIGSSDLSGADLPLQVTAIAGVTSDTTADSSGNFQVNGSYGTLVINKNGTYTYTLTEDASDILSGAFESFTYTVKDADGDPATATLKINLNKVDSAANPLHGDRVLTNIGGSGADIVISQAALLYNDDAGSTVNGTTSAITDATSVTSGSGNYTFKDNDSNGGKFTYHGQNGSLTDSAIVTVDRSQAGSSTLNGTSFGEILIGRDSNDMINGGGGDDYIVANGGNDTIDGGTGADVMIGGTGDDIYVVDNAGDVVVENASQGTDTINASISYTLGNNVENLTLTGSGNISGTGNGLNNVITGNSGNNTLSGGDGNDKLIGGDGNDTLDGGAGNDTLVGGAGNDTLTGGSGNDQFRLTTNSGTDVIKDFHAGTDKIALLDNNSNSNGSVNFGETIGNSTGAALSVSDWATATNFGAITPNDDRHVIRVTSAQTQDQIDAAVIKTGFITNNNLENAYIIVFNSDSGRGEIWFDSNWGNTGNRVKVATLDNITSIDQLNAITAADIFVYNNAADPLVLDLDNNGYAFSTLGDGAAFDLDADGKKDQLAWNSSGDGILAYDLNGNGTIDDGSELFTPWFNGGNFANGSAALASLDSNGDGVIDANDDAFGKLQIWQDANGDGVSDAGELKSLADHGITSLSASTTAANSSIDGQAIVGEGTFTRADGTTGGYVEVELDIVSGGGEAPVQGETIIGTDDDDFLTGTDGDDIIIGGLGNDTLTGGAGADTFVFSEAGPDNSDTITDFVTGEDAIDLGGLLDAALIDTNNVGDYVRVQDTGADALLQVNTTGTGDNWVDVATLTGHGDPGTVIDLKIDDDQYTVTIPTI